MTKNNLYFINKKNVLGDRPRRHDDLPYIYTQSLHHSYPPNIMYIAYLYILKNLLKSSYIMEQSKEQSTGSVQMLDDTLCRAALVSRQSAGLIDDALSERPSLRCFLVKHHTIYDVGPTIWSTET
jgi:hypothetical protein